MFRLFRPFRVFLPFRSGVGTQAPRVFVTSDNEGFVTSDTETLLTR
jgi:hypothetical protein